MKHKLEIASVRANERALLNEHLNEMSARGWRLCRMGGFYLRYEKCDTAYRWHVGFNDDLMPGAPRYIGIQAQKQIDLYEEMGYTFVTGFRRFLIYRSDTAVAPAFSDEQSEHGAMQQALRSERFFQVIIPAMLLAVSLILPLCSPSGCITLLSDMRALGAWLFAALTAIVLLIFFFQRQTHTPSWHRIRLRPWILLLLLLSLAAAMLGCVWAFTGSVRIVISLIMEALLLIVLSIVFAQINSMKPSRAWGFVHIAALLIIIPLSALISFLFVTPQSTSDLPQQAQSPVMRHIIGEQNDIRFDYIEVAHPSLLPAAKRYFLADHAMDRERTLEAIDIYVPDSAITDAIAAANGGTLKDGRSILLIGEDRALYVHEPLDRPYTETELRAIIARMKENSGT